MNAATRSVYGSPDVLTVREVETPVPGRREALIRVCAATVNRTDCANLTGEPFVMKLVNGYPRPRSSIPGTDFAGEVVAVGPEAGSFAVGDRVFGFDDTGLGSHAQFLLRSAGDAVARIPDGISFDQAAASAEGAHYALNILKRTGVKPGWRVLVNGSTGAIGTACLQLLRIAGAHTTAVCGAAHLDLVRSLGAEHAIDYTKEDFTRGDALYDLVIDTVGTRPFGESKRVLTPRGVYTSTELGPRVENPFLALITPLFGGKRVVFPVPTDIAGTLEHMRLLLEEGTFKPIIDRTFSLDRIADAYRYVASGQKVGNVLVTP